MELKMPRVKQETLNRILEHGAQLDQEVTALKTMLQMAWKTETPPIYHEVLIYITFPDEILVRPKITVG